MPNGIQILYEDNHLIAVNKTNHDLVQGDKTGDESLDQKLKKYLKEKYHKPGDVYLGMLHRLDRPVSGVVLFSRTSKAATRLSRMFKQNEIKKIYWAIVKNRPNPESGTLVHYLQRNANQNKSYAYNTEKNNTKKAELDYRLIDQSDNYYLLEIDLKTGRHHQIRAQLAAIDCPVKGDLKYGFPRSDKDGGISLHARMIEYMHPVKKENMVIKADPPDSPLWNYFFKEPDESFYQMLKN